MCYNWPGNIRQLENYIENIVNLEGRLSFDFIGDDKGSNSNLNNKNNLIVKSAPEINLDYSENKDVHEKINFNLGDIQSQIIKDAIGYCNHNVSKTAKKFGISRNTLHQKMKKYSIK